MRISLFCKTHDSSVNDPDNMPQLRWSGDKWSGEYELDVSTVHCSSFEPGEHVYEYTITV
jgi:hypothetical protein